MFLGFCGVLLLGGVSKTQAQELPDAKNYPRVNGSTSTLWLGQLLAARASGIDAQLRRNPFGWPQNSLSLTIPPDADPKIGFGFRALAARNNHEGTNKAYLSLINGKSDLILVARGPSKSELEAAKKAKVSFDSQMVARDAFVFLVNVKNPIQGLSTAQLQAIYTGKTKFWREIGVKGRDWPILALSRPRDSGSEELMNELFLKGQKMANFPPQTRLDEMGETIERVALNPEALGYSVFYFERFMMPSEKNKLLAIDGIAPTPQTIENNSYPFVMPIFAVTKSALKADSPATKLREWLLSENGQKLVRESGYVAAK